VVRQSTLGLRVGRFLVRLRRLLVLRVLLLHFCRGMMGL
jgi:hypothetical protein